LRTEYEKGWKITNIFLEGSTGVKTHRDHFVFDFKLSELRKRILDFRDLSISDSEIQERYNLRDTRDWKLSERRRSLSENPHWGDYFTKCLYRPFDIRNYYHHKDVVELPRDEVISNMLMMKNVALVTSRSNVVDRQWSHISCSKFPLDTNWSSANGGNYLFPLYIYENPKKSPIFSRKQENGMFPLTIRHPNFSSEFLKDLSEKLGNIFVQDSTTDRSNSIGPEDVFHYIYAILHSSTYRSRYSQFLKTDFPRIPLTRSQTLFKDLCGLGARLCSLHLMESVPEPVTRYPVVGTNLVTQIRFMESETNSRVWINETQYFEGIPLEVWNFHIGGYQVLEKWLKDRKGRTLSHDDLEHYRKVVVVLLETRQIQEEIDHVIGGWPIL